jgi:MFS family permease
MTGHPDSAVAGTASWRSLFAVAEFRGLWAAQALSILGDQLARVALTVLVFDRTGSALLTGLVYAVTMLPWLIGGPLLSGLADRYPRRTVMVVCSLGSGALIAALALPGLPLTVLVGLLFLAVLLEPPFLSARSALLTEVLPDDRYLLASTVFNVTQQTAQVAGFAAGGVLVGLIGARPALLADAATFLLAAGLILLASPPRPAAIHAATGHAGAAETTKPADSKVGWWPQITAGARLIAGNPRLRMLVGLAWLATFWVVPEGIAAPYAQTLGGGSATIGLLLAAQPAGTAAAGVILSRFVPRPRRRGLLLPLAALAGVAMLACAADPPLWGVLAALALSGVGCAYQLVANFEFMQAVPNAARGQAFGLAVTGLVAGQGLGLLAGGAAAEHLAPHFVVAAAGALGLLLLVGIASQRRYPRDPQPVAGLGAHPG